MLQAVHSKTRLDTTPVYSRFFGSTGYPTEGMANATAQGIIPQT